MIGVFSGADKMLLFLRLAAGFVSLEKDFVQYNSAGEREGSRDRENWWFAIIPSLSQRHGAFLQVQIPPIHWRPREVFARIPFRFSLQIKTQRQLT